MVDKKENMQYEMRGIILALEDLKEKEGEYAKISCNVMMKYLKNWVDILKEK